MPEIVPANFLRLPAFGEDSGRRGSVESAATMFGTVAITDHGWYEFLAGQPELDEVNFWTPSAHWAFRADVGSPFFFKLKARYGHAICGFASFARFARIPDWLAWDSFGAKNGCPSLRSMRERIGAIRNRIEYHSPGATEEIGCILLVQPHFFPPDEWVAGPHDWPPSNLRPMNTTLRLVRGYGSGPTALGAWRRTCPPECPRTRASLDTVNTNSSDRDSDRGRFG